MKATLALSLMLSASTSAFAADLAPQPAEPPVNVSSWTGFYLGAQAGVALDRGRWDNSADPNSDTTFGPFDVDSTGALIGGIVGYNYQIDQFVIGAEGQLSYIGIDNSESTSINPATFFPASNQTFTKQKWLGSVNLRLGYAFDRALAYTTGGVAFTSYELSNRFDLDGTIYTHDTGSQSRTGWNVGLGGEYALTDNWILGAEWRYYDFGTKTYSSGASAPAGPGFDFVKVKETENTFTARISYKF
jgi:outer membrane immunogenic protein